MKKFWCKGVKMFKISILCTQCTETANLKTEHKTEIDTANHWSL